MITPTKRESILISDIIVEDRQRIDLGDIAGLAESIRTKGLIQPIVINQNRRLIAGGRRLAAHQLLGRLTIDFVYKETLSESECFELELEENIRRKDMSWQERCLNIHRIHTLKRRSSLIAGVPWGNAETGEFLGLTGAGVQYNTEIAKKLLAEMVDGRPPTGPQTARYWACDSVSEAWKLRLRDEEEAIQASLAQDLARQSAQGVPARVQTGASGPGQVSSELLRELGQDFDEKVPAGVSNQPDLSSSALDRERAREQYLSNPHNPPEEFDLYYAERVARITAAQLESPKVYLTNMLFNISCIDFMNTHADLVDHIITDPPYAIDMDNLAQSTTGLVDIDTVADEHEVEDNQELFAQFFPAAFNCLKSNGYLVLWCDIMQWDRLYTLATLNGFKVQRWPITWVKTYRCMNQCAQQNFTKSTEIAMVCRKGTATLATIAGECHILAGMDEYKEQLGHPFVKPFDVWSFIIDHVSYEGQVVLEPFAGRGSGVISLLRKKRRVIGCELQTAHYNALLENVRAWYLTINSNFKFS